MKITMTMIIIIIMIMTMSCSKIIEKLFPLKFCWL